MAKYPNQKTITTHNDSSDVAKRLSDQGKYGFHIVVNDYDSQAMKELSPCAYKLYRYLNKNLNGYTFDLSSVDVANYTGISQNSYDRAVKELIEKRFLIPCPRRNNHYDFYVVGGDNTIINTGAKE